jgi:multidrug efflux pump subunit AcrB
MGLEGLVGVVVNDSIVMVDFIRNARSRGLNTFDASIEAARTRLRPIFLTTITTFFGLIPTAYGIGGNDPFLKPMAISMSWGLAFGTLVTLFGTPVLYNILNDIRKLFFKERMEAYEREPIAEKVADTLRCIESPEEQFPRKRKKR